MSMKITSFMTQYKFKKTEEEKENMVKSHIKNEYVPFEKKADVAKAIVDASFYKDEVGADGSVRKVFHIDSVAKHMLMCMAVIDLYTDIDRSKGNGKMLEDFNVLNGSGILDLVLQNINPRELKEFNMVLQMVCDDVMSNEYEPHAFITKQVERFGELISVIMLPLIDKIDLNEIKNTIRQGDNIDS